MIRSRTALVAGAACLVGGCSRAVLPVYSPPAGLPAAERVTITGRTGFYVLVVDNARVSSAYPEWVYGSNGVTLTPGHHRLTVRFLGAYSDTVAFECDLAAGHHYELVADRKFALWVDSVWPEPIYMADLAGGRQPPLSISVRASTLR